MTENQAEYHTKDEEPKRVKCVIPDCSLWVAVKSLVPDQPPLCKEHLEAFKVFKFFISKVQFRQTPAPPPQIAVPRLVTPSGNVLRR